MSLKRMLSLSLTFCFILGVVFLIKGSAGAAPFGHSELFTHISTNSPDGAFFPLIRSAPDGTLLIGYNHNLGGGGSRPYYSVSGNGGQSWSTPAPIYNGSNQALQINVSFDSNNRAHAVWYTTSDADNDQQFVSEVFYAPQNQWPGAALPVATGAEGRSIVDPSIKVAPNGRLVVAWLQSNANGVPDVYYGFSNNGGSSWTINPLTNPADDNGSYSYDMAVDGNGVLHIVWSEDGLSPTPGRIFENEIKYSKGTWNGSSYGWATPVALTDVDDAFKPSIVVADNRLHVTFELREEEERDDLRDKVYPYYMSASLNGSNWTTPEDVTKGRFVYVPTSLPYFLGTSLTVCEGQPYVYYHGSPMLDTAERIWRVRREGNNWTRPTAITQEPDQRFANPSSTCPGSTPHLTFSEIQIIGVNHQILYGGDPNLAFLPVISRSR